MAGKKRTSRKHRVAKNRRRVRRNSEKGMLQSFVLPALVGAGGMLASQWVASSFTSRLLVGQDPRLQFAVTGAGIGALALVFGEGLGLSHEVAEAAAIGAGISAIQPWLPKVVSDTTPVPATPAVSGMGLMVDVSHYGAPYKGLFGLGGPVDLPAVSTVTPTDLAFPAKRVAEVKEVTAQFASPKTDRGYAGGIFARQLFSGVMA